MVIGKEPGHQCLPLSIVVPAWSLFNIKKITCCPDGSKTRVKMHWKKQCQSKMVRCGEK